MRSQLCSVVPCVVLAIACVAGGLTAQVTWTNLDLRHDHALASDPSRQTVSLFGGERSGSQLGDTWERGGSEGWVLRSQSGPSARQGHAMAFHSTGTDAAAIAVTMMFGGYEGTRVSNETWTLGGGYWSRQQYTTTPSARRDHAMVYDAFRRVVMLFGGQVSGAPDDETWEWSSVSGWTQKFPTVMPPLRWSHALAYDSFLGTVLLFGGSPNRNDTWEYDGNQGPEGTWTNVTPTGTNPAGRSEHALAFDADNGEVVLFGGRNTAGVLGDTWVWDSANKLWIQRFPATNPPARAGHAMEFDWATRRVILVGGIDDTGQPLPGTWEWNGVNWAQQAPSLRTGVQLTSESASGTSFLMFGGLTAGVGSELADTWRLTGATWTKLSPNSQVPSARAEYGMAWDSRRNRMVLWGGKFGVSYPCDYLLDDTWEWDGSLWSPRSPTTKPPEMRGRSLAFDPVRGNCVMFEGPNTWLYDGADWRKGDLLTARGARGVYDEARGRVMFFGGQVPVVNPTDGTWLWDGSTWRRARPSQEPSPRDEAAVAYDPFRQRVVLFGGKEGYGPGNGLLNDTWEWDGTDWQQRVAPNQLGQPPSRTGAAYAFDRARRQVVLFGGWGDTGRLGDTWVWDGSTWLQRNPATAPPARGGAAMAYDEARARVVLYSGLINTGFASDTWEWDGSDWSIAGSPIAAPASQNASLEWHSGRGKVVLFGGDTGGQLYNDLWEWDGSQWTKFAANNPLAPRALCCFTYDRARSRLVVFGGYNANSSYNDDTWEWDGTTWQQRLTTPVTRGLYGMAWDERRQVVLMFGGRGGCDPATGSYFNETWEWDGAWTLRTPLPSPSPRSDVNLTFDRARGRIILYGGRNAAATLGDTWEWDGTTWTERFPVVSPNPMAGHGLAYDPVRGAVVGFGTSGTWEYTPVNAAAYVAFGAGCAGSVGVPSLVAEPGTGPWIGFPLQLNFTNLPANQISSLLFGASNVNWFGVPLPLAMTFLGLPQCNLLISVDASVPFFNATGTTGVSFLVPADPAFVGLSFFNQAFTLDPLGAGGAMTNGGAATIGAK